ncbi:MAG TPA: DUF929 family protein [Rhodanobacteraceae bacterium]
MSRWTGTLLAAAASLLAIIPAAHAGIFGPTGSRTPPMLAVKLDKPVAPALVATLDKASQSGLAVKTTPTPVYLSAIDGADLGTGGKVGVLYMGGDFCPYCAGQRWGLMLTLLRFGRFSGLHYMLSSDTDVYPSTPTVTFQHATYTSKYVDFQAVELSDRDGKQLMQPDALQKKIFLKFDAPPYTRYAQGIPFVYVDGHYMLSAPIVLPSQIHGLNWQQIANALGSPNSPLAQAVMPRVNLLTAAICQRLGAKGPAKVCKAPGVKAAAAKLPAVAGSLSAGNR